MSAKVKFLPAADSSQLEDAGAAEAARLMRDANFDKLLDDRDDQWFQWLDASERPHLGWSPASPCRHRRGLSHAPAGQA